MDTVKTRKKRGDFFTVAQQVAQAIMDHYDSRGHAPGTSDIVAALGYSSTGAVSQIIKKMAARGWIYHQPRKHNDLALTGLGRTMLFGRVEEEMHVDVPVRPNASTYEIRAAKAQVPPPQVEMVEREPVATVRREPEQAPVVIPAGARVGNHPSPLPPVRAVATPDLTSLDTLDLVLELASRGLKVTRR